MSLGKPTDKFIDEQENGNKKILSKTRRDVGLLTEFLSAKNAKMRKREKSGICHQKS